MSDINSHSPISPRDLLKLRGKVNECVGGLVTKGAELIRFPDPKRESEL